MFPALKKNKEQNTKKKHSKKTEEKNGFMNFTTKQEKVHQLSENFQAKVKRSTVFPT